ncbi:MAG: hypothetical protein KF850_32405 [Labilithrix sp.]|nr:hypothetical protein [Labilithrix sp.]
MKISKRGFPLVVLPLLGLLVVAPACSGEDADDTIVEPSRESRIESLASAVCERYADTGAGCPGYGTGDDQKYATESDCEADFHTKAANLWPAERCDSGRIDNARYESCVTRAKNYACSEGAQNIVDAISALDECSASKVCTDSAN